ncbi:MAG: FHA domain-containing protein [Anaerolineae bacterium]|nr:FHA domain-containing protein [Anaerolineae bacterium]
MQGNETFRLVVRRGPQPNQVYELDKDIITLGRDITNNITINDPEVSRHHMRLTRGAGGFTLEDLGSTNGTFVNGQRLTGAKPLSNGDMIGLGETVTLQYELVRAMSAGVGTGMPEVMPTSPGPAARQPAAAPMNVAPQMQPQTPQQQPAYDYAPQQSYTPTPPPSTGYDYDPYAVREEEPRNMTRWIIIGCAALSLLCCCGTIAGLFLIDTLCLWNSLPLISDIIRALGWTVTC